MRMILCLGLWLAVTPAFAQPGDWPNYDGALTGNRYSPLSQINAANVSSLNLACQRPCFPTHSNILSHGKPFVVDTQEAGSLGFREGFALSAPRSGVSFC